MTGWAPPKRPDDDWKDRQVIRLNTGNEIRNARKRWETLQHALHSALGDSAYALLCYETRDGRVHVWINDAQGQALDLTSVPNLQWLLDETADLLGSGTWRL